MFSSKTDLWETPQEFFNEMNKEFDFTTDVCAIPENAKCDCYFTPQVDGLKIAWTGRCWCNPPYGREIGKWVKKASDEVTRGIPLCVMLLPARTDTKWFHDYIYNKSNVEIRFLKGRLKFGGAKNAAPFPSMLVVFRGESK